LLYNFFSGGIGEALVTPGPLHGYTHEAAIVLESTSQTEAYLAKRLQYHHNRITMLLCPGSIIITGSTVSFRVSTLSGPISSCEQRWSFVAQYIRPNGGSSEGMTRCSVVIGNVFRYYAYRLYTLPSVVFQVRTCNVVLTHKNHVSLFLLFFSCHKIS